MSSAKSVSVHFVHLLRDRQLQYIATSLAYNTVLSIVPVLAILLSLMNGFGFLKRYLGQVRPLLLQHLAVGTGQEFVQWLEHSVQRINNGAMGSFGFLILLFISTKLLNDIDVAIQRVWGVNTYRPLVKRVMYYWIVLLFAPILLAVLTSVPYDAYIPFVRFMPRMAPGVLIGGLLLFLTFKWVPNRSIRAWTSGLSAFITILALFVSQRVYAWAAHSVLSYNKIYGSLASVFLFLVWVLIFWYIFIFGVAFNSLLQGTDG